MQRIQLPILLLIIAGILVSIGACSIDIMDVDAAQYANISREMSITNNFLQVKELGKDYLDKPPLLFWLNALSMKALGDNNLAYKLPSILIFVLSLFSFFALIQQLYDRQTAWIGSLILSSSQAVFLMCNDVRTDLLLMSFTIMSISHLYLYTENKKITDFVLGFVALSLGLMSKGPICLIALVASLGIHFILKKQWKNILNSKYLFGLVIVLVMLIPMCYGLYQQFDLHPEKYVYGMQGPSGLKFFFWTQSFGRITGESTWSNNAGFSFLFGNILWAFFPWSLLFIIALITKTYTIYKNKAAKEYISFGGFIIIYIALSSSKYQLPHYIFIAFPLMSIIVAEYLTSLHQQWKKYILLLSILLIIICQVAVVNLVFTDNGIFWSIFILLEIIAGSLLFYYFKRDEQSSNYSYILTSAFFMICLNFFMIQHFYTNLLKYQSSSNLGRYIRNNYIEAKEIDSYRIKDGMNALHFYAGQAIITSTDDFPTKKYVITNDEGLHELQTSTNSYKIKKTFPQFNITKLNVAFLNHQTREKRIKHTYLLEKTLE